MNWIILIIAGLFEVVFAACLGKAKETTGTTSVLWLIGFLSGAFTSMYLLYRAILILPIGTAYGIWTGIGAVGTVLVSIFIFKEPADFWKIFFITTLIGSIIGLKIVSN
jgi:quaternary ammonium compound-resistance protein SugE